VIEIYGTVTDLRLASFTITYSQDAVTWSSAGIHCVGNGGAPITGALLATWNISSLITRDYWVLLSAVDKAGHQKSTVVTVNFQNLGLGDVVPPSIVSVRFDGKSIVTGDAVNSSPRVSIVITDNVRIITWAAMLIFTDTGATSQSVTADLRMQNQAIVSTDWVLNALPEGRYAINVRATDVPGTTTEYTSPEFIVKPTFQLNRVLSGPNPFNPLVENVFVSCELTQPADVEINIYALNGIRVWKTQALAPAGYNEWAWNGHDPDGRIVGNGVYIVTLQAHSLSGEILHGMTKMAVLK
jgi:hypothetical protein